MCAVITVILFPLSQKERQQHLMQQHLMFVWDNLFSKSFKMQSSGKGRCRKGNTHTHTPPADEGPRIISIKRSKVLHSRIYYDLLFFFCKAKDFCGNVWKSAKYFHTHVKKKNNPSLIEQCSRDLKKYSWTMERLSFSSHNKCGTHIGMQENLIIQCF